MNDLTRTKAFLIAVAVVMLISACSAEEQSASGRDEAQPTPNVSAADGAQTPEPAITAQPVLPEPDASDQSPAPGPPDPVAPANVVVAIGEEYRIADNAILVVQQVIDERCVDAECAWEGELTALLRWQDDIESHDLTSLWRYHADAVPAPGGRYLIGVWDVEEIDGIHYVHLEITEAQP